MVSIKLERGEWQYDPGEQLGPEGGFGIVFAGSSDNYGRLAVKKLKIGAKEAAHRELKICKELADRQLMHVIPVLDSGQDAQSNSYFVVMPRAEKSLQDELNTGKIFGYVDAANVLLEVAVGLSEVPDIVHRDLKPGNVLYHQGTWKISDFGIARFVEESTSLHTVKGNLTPQYAAPEQWQDQRATSATDIYALGCIGYALLTGHPPFEGSGLAEQHVQHTPPTFHCGSPKLESLLHMMLRKAAQGRPDVERVKRILAEVVESGDKRLSQPGLEALAQAGAQVASRQAQEEIARKKAEAEMERRRNIAKGAFDILKDITERLFDRVCSLAPAAHRTADDIRLGEAKLCVERRYYGDDRLIRCEAFPQSKWDVLAAGEIAIIQRDPSYTWSACLWYSKLPDDDNYRWREVSYFGNPLIPKDRLRIEFEPFALKSLSDADEAASPVMGVYQIAFGPKPIDDEDFEEFCNRWAELLAKAANGELRHPPFLPLQ